MQNPDSPIDRRMDRRAYVLLLVCVILVLIAVGLATVSSMVETNLLRTRQSVGARNCDYGADAAANVARAAIAEQAIDWGGLTRDEAEAAALLAAQGINGVDAFGIPQLTPAGVTTTRFFAVETSADTSGIDMSGKTDAERAALYPRVLARSMSVIVHAKDDSTDVTCSAKASFNITPFFHVEWGVEPADTNVELTALNMDDGVLVDSAATDMKIFNLTSSVLQVTLTGGGGTIVLPAPEDPSDPSCDAGGLGTLAVGPTRTTSAIVEFHADISSSPPTETADWDVVDANADPYVPTMSNVSFDLATGEYAAVDFRVVGGDRPFAGSAGADYACPGTYGVPLQIRGVTADERTQTTLTDATAFEITVPVMVVGNCGLAPTVAITNTPQSGNIPGSSTPVCYSTTVTNNDEAGCGTKTFALSTSNVEGGYTAAWGNPSVSLAPGATSTSEVVTFTLPSGAATGAHTFTATITHPDSANFGDSVGTYTVNGCGLAPTVTMTNTPQSGASPASQTAFSYSTSVKNNDAASCGTKTFALSTSGVEGGYTAAWGNSTVSLAPAATSTSEVVTYTLPAGATVASHTFTAIAAHPNSGFTGSGVGTYTVLACTKNAATVSSTPSSSTGPDNVMPDTITSTIRVTNADSGPGCGAVTYNLTTVTPPCTGCSPGTTIVTSVSPTSCSNLAVGSTCTSTLTMTFPVGTKKNRTYTTTVNVNATSHTQGSATYAYTVPN